MYPTQLFGLRVVYDSSETQKQKDSKINNKKGGCPQHTKGIRCTLKKNS